MLPLGRYRVLPLVLRVLESSGPQFRGLRWLAGPKGPDSAQGALGLGSLAVRTNTQGISLQIERAYFLRMIASGFSPQFCSTTNTTAAS